MSQNNKKARDQRGFSLTELLVAVAITTIVMGGILGVLISVMRATSRGHAIQQAYELARGTYESMETDLAAAYVSRDTGDDFKFFGCPFGFSFIAALDPDDPERLSRVSYFIHVESVNGEVEFYEQGTGEYVPKGTVSLVRYVESGVTDLDVYPVDWVASITDPSIEPGPFQDEWQALADEMANTYVSVSDNTTTAYDVLEGLGDFRLLDIRRDIPVEHDLMVRAKLRELWLRVLAGDPNFPTYFANDDPSRAAITDLNWQDYVIAERMPYQTRDGEAVVQIDGSYVINQSMVDYANPADVRPQYFSYGTRFNVVASGFDADNDGLFDTELDEDISSGSVDMFTTFWGSVYNVKMAQAIYVPKGNVQPTQELLTLGSPLDPSMPELIGLNTGVELGSPFVGVPEFDEDFVQIIDVPVGFRRKEVKPFNDLFVSIGP